jgi:SAM-dependent methyltransferase
MRTILEPDELWPDTLPNSFLNRAKETIKFIQPTGKIADCGEDNPLKRMIEYYHVVSITSIDWNFNEPLNIADRYDTILAFEVLEHIFNPLVFLNSIKRLLSNNGSIYLSTPYQLPQIIKAIHHYHEIPTDRLMWLFDEARLKIVRSGKITIAGNWYEHIHGIRPILRYFQKTRIYELKNAKEISQI